jgi:hypothetical protein
MIIGNDPVYLLEAYMAFTWSAQYETNIGQVDEQHQTIPNQINQLLEQMKLARPGMN